MIYTVTFNPSLDYIADVEDFKLGLTNRTSKEALYPGGKGINVSMVLKNLGLDSSALGFIAGFTGSEIQRKLEERKINTDFIQLDEGYSRINVKLRAAEETEINGIGPDIGTEALQALYKQLDTLSEGDYLVLAGSIPNSMPADTYEQIAAHLDGRGIRIAVDATKDLLMNVLRYHPFVIKPNNHELAEMFGVTLTGNAMIAEYAKRLREMGAQNVIISMAGDGAIFVPENGEPVFLPAPKGQVVNSVGAGDSMVAGFVAGNASGLTREASFRLGVATGSASAFSELLATKEDVDRLLETLPEPQLIV
ncbi:MAG: 1-phosphofructokinase [Eubacteriaceae bacterium]|jgi:1-phosphofructokinase